MGDPENVAVCAVADQIVDLVFLRNFHFFELDEIFKSDSVLGL